MVEQGVKRLTEEGVPEWIYKARKPTSSRRAQKNAVYQAHNRCTDEGAPVFLWGSMMLSSEDPGLEVRSEKLYRTRLPESRGENRKAGDGI